MSRQDHHHHQDRHLIGDLVVCCACACGAAAVKHARRSHPRAILELCAVLWPVVPIIIISSNVSANCQARDWKQA
jgi:hypothetical protein